MLMRGARGACAVCGKWRMSKNWLNVSEKCEQCEFPIERKEGHFVGAVGINTMVTFSLVLIGALLAFAFTKDNFRPGLIFVIMAPLTILFSTVFFPISKTLWSAMDLTFMPLERGEVDPRFDPTISLESEEA